MEDTLFLWERLKKAEKPILIYGMGDGCDKILSVCREKDIRISGIFASDEFVREKTVHGFPLTSFAKARETFGDMIVLLAFGVFRSDMTARLLELSKQCELYAPEVPLFGKDLFDREYYTAHRNEIEKARALMADEASVRIFDRLVCYKISGKIDALLGDTTTQSEDLATLVRPQKGDIYLDLGAYDGDTVSQWHRLFPEHGKIVGVEPNHKTFLKMQENCRDIPFFEGLEAAAWCRRETLRFNGKTGRSAALSEFGSATVFALPPDDMVVRADYIKYDVEGAEKEAIEGSERLIREYRPKLCISAYHRTEDFFALPLQVHRLLPDYRTFLRRGQYIPAWDTVYYFIP